MKSKMVPAVWMIALCLLAATAAVAQEPEAAPDADMQAMMEAWQRAGTPGEPHQQLARSEGSWKMTVRSWMDPNAEPMVSEGSAEKKMTLGGRVLEEMVKGDMMGTPFDGVARSGYDNVTGKYWATWTDSMSTGVYVSHGSADEKGDVTMHGEYDDPMTGGTIKVRSVLRWQDENTHSFEWHEDRGEGFIKTMEITYERAGA